MARTFLEMLAPAVQRLKSTFYGLHHRCKSPKAVFSVCTIGATVPKWFFLFAPVVQGPKSSFFCLHHRCKQKKRGFWGLHRWCKRFPKHFDRYSALSKTSFRSKEPHSFVELTLNTNRQGWKEVLLCFYPCWVIPSVEREQEYSLKKEYSYDMRFIQMRPNLKELPRL